MDNIIKNVPLNVFIDGITAQADIDTIRALVTTGVGYCSDDIMAVLGLSVERKGDKDGRTD